jgi:hypothetical protein
MLSIACILNAAVVNFFAIFAHTSLQLFRPLLTLGNCEGCSALKSFAPTFCIRLLFGYAITKFQSFTILERLSLQAWDKT